MICKCSQIFVSLLMFFFFACHNRGFRKFVITFFLLSYRRLNNQRCVATVTIGGFLKVVCGQLGDSGQSVTISILRKYIWVLLDFKTKVFHF